MDDLLRPVKSVQSNIARFESLSVNDPSEDTRSRQSSSSSARRRKRSTPDTKNDTPGKGSEAKRLVQEVGEDDELLSTASLAASGRESSLFQAESISPPSKTPPARTAPTDITRFNDAIIFSSVSSSYEGALFPRTDPPNSPLTPHLPAADLEENTSIFQATSSSDKENSPVIKLKSANDLQSLSTRKNDEPQGLRRQKTTSTGEELRKQAPSLPQDLHLDVSSKQSHQTSATQGYYQPVSPTINPISPDAKPSPLSLKSGHSQILSETPPGRVKAPTPHDYKASPVQSSSANHNITSPQEALAILKGQPDRDQLRNVLAYLGDGIDGKHMFNVKLHSALASSLVSSLVRTAVADYWENLQSSEKDRAALLKCLDNVAGLASLWSFLGIIMRDFKPEGVQGGFELKSHRTLARSVLDVLSNVLLPVKGYSFLSKTLHDIFRLYGSRSGAREAMIQELTNLIAGSRILSAVSEAAYVIGCVDSGEDENAWMADGSQWSIWLGSNLAHVSMQTELVEEEKWRAIGSITKRGLSLGHPGKYWASYIVA